MILAMIILDTNAISEPISPEPETRVLQWFDRQYSQDLYLTSITVAEMLAGVQKLPSGRRKEGISFAIDEILNVTFAGRILVFDIAAARSYATVYEGLRKTGFNADTADVQIAAIAQLHGARVATRDVKPFRAAGLNVINPWTDE
jgi:toxin FitB